MRALPTVGYSAWVVVERNLKKFTEHEKVDQGEY